MIPGEMDGIIQFVSQCIVVRPCNPVILCYCHLPAALSSSVKTVSRAPGAGTGVQGHLDNGRLLGVLDQSTELGCCFELPLLKQCHTFPCLVPCPNYFHLSSCCALQITKFKFAVLCSWHPGFLWTRAAHSPSLPFCFVPTKDKDFGKQALRKEHVNPPAEVSTSLKTYQHFTLEKAYLREDFFWAFTPTAGDFIRFRFFKPLRIERPVLEGSAGCGDSPEHLEAFDFCSSGNLNQMSCPSPAWLPRSREQCSSRGRII